MKKLICIISTILLILCISPLAKAKIPFELGIEYTFVGKPDRSPTKEGFAQVYQQMGATLTKPMDQVVYQIVVQKNCGDPFDWSAIDGRVLEYQKYGFDFLIVLATRYDKKPSNYSQEEIVCYQNYVRETVERFDGDGIKDMPGLKKPIVYWQVDSEFRTGFFDQRTWGDPGGEYVRMLELANPPIREAMPNAKILTISWQSRAAWTDVDGEKRTYENMSDWKVGSMTKTFEAINKVFDRQELWDITCFNLIEDYSAMPGLVRWLKASMKDRDFQKPIFASDLSYSMTPVMTGPVLLYPYHGKVYDFWKPKSIQRYWKGVGLINQLAKEKSTGPTYRWFKREQAIFMVKALTTAIGEGVEAMNVHSAYSQAFPWRLLFQRLGAGTFGWCGLVESDWSVGPFPQEKWPAYYATKDVVALLKTYDSVVCKSITLHNGQKIHRYDFKRLTYNLSVMWLDDRIGNFPDEQQGSVPYLFKEPNVSTAVVRHMVFDDANTLSWNEGIHKDGDDGRVDQAISLTITEVPVMIFY